MSQAENAMAERIVSETDHVQLSRLVTEHAWRVDNGRAETLHELYVDDGELDVGRLCVDGRRLRNGGGNVKRVASAVGEGSIAVSFVHQVLGE